VSADERSSEIRVQHLSLL
jgi:hypothetical protein